MLTRIPVKSDAGVCLYYVRLEDVPRLLAREDCYAVGTHHRIRAIIWEPREIPLPPDPFIRVHTKYTSLNENATNPPRCLHHTASSYRWRHG